MSILSKYIEIIIDSKNKYNKYKKLGYNVTLNKSSLILLEDVPKGCRSKILVSCDECGYQFEIAYRSYNVNPKYPEVLCTK